MLFISFCGVSGMTSIQELVKLCCCFRKVSAERRFVECDGRASNSKCLTGVIKKIYSDLQVISCDSIEIGFKVREKILSNFLFNFTVFCHIVFADTFKDWVLRACDMVCGKKRERRH